ncbi:FtsW/RodA/SpoVE family cell cycle protein [Ruficoccus sp. ZRK36]|uniref:FtsW/RodA/SpoVE family cell cycle protein n=1 Tax=Ruficoccus sp. ZRK36 TaxID=2866311 RepID=UPI001C72D135|nr:FtsW/RodA/SpoVE family cell cycle protein [Ruficoccus sp. ZRK36]QYY36082.1 rod shape-determining protein RodA [Ruficoccus sp. ZRK36]
MSSLISALKRLPLRHFVRISDEHRSDWISPVCILLLGLIGVFFIYSAQSYSGGSSWKMQILWLVVGFIAYGVISLVNYKFFLENAHLFYWLGVLLLVPLALQAIILDLHSALSSIPAFRLPFVQTRFGATRWLDFGPFSLQPAEVAKVSTLLMASSVLARSEIGTLKESIKVLLKVGFTFFIPVFLIFLEPDLGSSLVFAPMAFALLYVSNLSEKFFLTIFGLFLLATLVIGVDVYRYQQFMNDEELSFMEDKGAYEEHSFVPLKDYQRNRILAFVAPQVVDPKGNGVAWNLNQSLMAVSGGGLYGKGPGQGTQAKLGYLPPTVAPNDFIFSVLAEESGFLGSMVVIILFAILIANGIRIAGIARDRFGMLLSVGVSIIFMVHIFVNIGMTIGLMPITGLPLPFISYGGSFVLSCCVLQGFVQSVYRFRKDFS